MKWVINLNSLEISIILSKMIRNIKEASTNLSINTIKRDNN